MQELAKSIDKSIDSIGLIAVDDNPLDAAAKKWATHSLGSFDGRLLRKALAISAAMAEFTSELHKCTYGGAK